MARTSKFFVAIVAAGLLGAGSASAEWGGGYGGTPGGSAGSSYGGSSGGTWGGSRGQGGGTWGGSRASGGSTWGGGQSGYGGSDAGWGSGRRPGNRVGYGGSKCYYCRATPDRRFPASYPIRPRPPVWNRGGYPVDYGRRPANRYPDGY